ncbi:phage tail tape measure protein [Hymenobacter chitinivorans]|uniref:Minor tail protein n=1 Tax=Hymenobacter chitinivorans DSM 11115 TaxID=1121954 RepID=A0A2M9BNC9_9BACT|nr:phage tail tape measure protein [Hymenobacter chitinivorans]PJJ59452.1 minor tail protein [Hymenobacter chitinivorans DSM 11115]
MADNSEERKIKILLDAVQPNASIKEMTAGASLMNNQLAKMSADDPGRAKLQDDFARLTARITEARMAQRTIIKTTEELAEEQRQLQLATEKLNQENREVVLNGQKVSASFKDMKAAGALLEQQLHELSADDPGRAKLLRDYQELQKRIDGVKKEMGETAEKGFTMKDALTFAGVGVGLEAAVDVVKEMGAEIAQTVKEFEDLRSQINTLTGATGAELDELSTSVAAVAKTFDKDFNEVLLASNTLSKQMGISQQEAIRLIEQGFLSGADASGEFLDQVKEYAPQFKAAGLSANEAIGVISQSVTTGIFSDKGADVVKEFGLRIREQTKSTKDAMYAAFGPEFTKEILDGVNDGSLSSVEALRKVSQQMNDTKIPASQLQTVIADVFGGPGEDAGLEYLKSLRNVSTGVDGLVDSTNVYTQRQQVLLASQKELASVQNDLAKQFEGSSTVLDTLTNKGLTVLYALLGSLAATFKELVAPVQEIWDAFVELGESLGLVSKEGLSAKSMGEALGNVFRLLMVPTKLLWGLVADLVRGFVDWAKSSEVARAALTVMTLPIRTLFELLSNGPAYFAGFSAAAESSFGTIGRAWRKILDRDFGGAADEFKNIGKAAGDAYTKAFADATAKRAAASSTSTSGGAEAPEGPTKAAGGDGMTESDKAKAEKDAEAARKKAKEARDKVDQDRLNDIKRFVQAEGKEMEGRNALLNQLGEREVSDAEARRILEQQKIFDAATDRVRKLTGSEADYTEQVKAIVEERDLQLRELADKHAEEEEKRRQEAIDKKLELAAAEAEEQLAALELKLANGVLDEWAYQDAVYAVKLAAHERELELLKEKSGAETAEYKKANANKLKEQAEYAAKKKNLDQDLVKAEQLVSAVKKVLGEGEINLLAEIFGKKSAIYKAAVVVQKTMAAAEVGISLAKQIAVNTETGTKISAMAPPVSIPIGTAYTIGANLFAGGVAAVQIGKIMGMGFRSGGRTSGGGGPLDLAGLQVGPNGKLIDQDGFAVAGVVHENEYVIPEWMRADPQVAQMEQWLEARRQRGFITGGPTTEGSSQAVDPDVELLGSGDVVSLLRQLVAGQEHYANEVGTWARELQVVQQDLVDLNKDLDVVKQIQRGNGITG